MSYCKELGKDQVIFLTEEDAAKPSSIELPEQGEAPQGLITESGEINWSCPCLGGMAVGPCGVEFREAFSCFHFSEAQPKGSECFDKFVTMQECMKDYPELYDKSSRADDDDDVELNQTQVAELNNTEKGAKEESLDQLTEAPVENEEKVDPKVDIIDEKIEPNSSRVDESAEESVQNTQKSEDSDAVESKVEVAENLERNTESVEELEQKTEIKSGAGDDVGEQKAEDTAVSQFEITEAKLEN